MYEPIFKALERDTRLLQLYVLNNNSAALKNSVNGADTVQVSTPRSCILTGKIRYLS